MKPSITTTTKRPPHASCLFPDINVACHDTVKLPVNKIIPFVRGKENNVTICLHHKFCKWISGTYMLLHFSFPVNPWKLHLRQRCECSIKKKKTFLDSERHPSTCLLTCGKCGEHLLPARGAMLIYTVFQKKVHYLYWHILCNIWS